MAASSWPPRVGASPDDVFAAVEELAAGRGLSLYPHQEEALIELVGGSNVVLATPTGSGKSLVAIGAHAAALATDRVSFYTAPIKALVSEKFFDLCAVLGAENVGMLTGDASVNADAPVICCTAEILANLALREGRSADVGLVIMDEFHYYAEPDRGWAWQVPLLELSDVQFLLMSATLGDMRDLAEDLSRRTGRPTAIIADAERPVPLDFQWSLDPLAERLEEIVTTGQAPVYVVHFTQAAAVEHATGLLQAGWLSGALDAAAKERIEERLRDVRFAAGFGRTLVKLLKKGIGVHHAGMLPRYRRLVEQLAQDGALRVICGTDTLGVGINVPIRTVLFTGLVKFDGHRQRVLRVREFRQIAGRAGRAGFDTVGYVVVQAPEHVIENERAKAKAEAKNAANPKKRSKAQLRKAPEGTVVWNEQTFARLVEGEPERLVSRMRIDNAMLLSVLGRDEDAFPVLRRLLMDNHEERRQQLRLARRALRLTRSLTRSGVLTRLEEPDEHGRRYVVQVDLPDDFALNQPLAHFALAALELLEPDPAGGEDAALLDVVSTIEAVVESPRQILMAQQWAARGEAIAEMKADGLEYDERMELLEEITWPRPLAERLEAAYELYRAGHPWLPEDAAAAGLEPKSIVREMYEQGMGFTDLVSRYQLARSEGLVLRYLTDAYKALRQTVPERFRDDAFETLLEWLGETVRQTDSSLLDEWEALSDPDHAPRDVTEHVPPAAPRPLSRQERAFGVMVRNAMFRRVELIARDAVDALAALDAAAAERLEERPIMDAPVWDAALEAYYADHDRVDLGPDARGPRLLTTAERVEDGRRLLDVRQTVLDPEGHLDWVVDAVADLDATDREGELVLQAVALRRLDR